MAIDGIILDRVRKELVEGLPMRINRIQEISLNEFIFNVHSANIRKNLVISTHSLYNRIHFTDMNYKLVDDPSSFVMGLRKRLINGVIYDIKQYNYDRYLVFMIKSLDEMYDERNYRLHVELMGKYANIILVDDATNKIIDALKKIPPYENNRRILQIGATFTDVDKQDKEDLFAAADIDTNDSLTGKYYGVSPLLEKEIKFRVGNGESFKDIIEKLSTSDKLYISENGNSLEFHLIELKHLGKLIDCMELDEGFDYIYFELEEKERIKHLSNDLFKFVRREIKHYKTRIAKLNESLIQADQADVFQEYGNLLFMESNHNIKGLKEIEVTDYEGKTTKIPLDEKLSIKSNANKYFQRYRKLKNSVAYTNQQLDIAQNHLDYLSMIEQQLEIAGYQDAIEIREELVNNDYLREKKNVRKKKKVKNINYYSFEYNGHHIYYGKNNLQNEYVTFKLASKDWLWFHAKGYHGAHVVVDTPTPEEETLRLCANLAGYLSKGRDSSSTPIDYTLVKNIKKVKNKNPGFVTFDTNQTIYIDPDRNQLRELKII